MATKLEEGGGEGLSDRATKKLLFLRLTQWWYLPKVWVVESEGKNEGRREN